MHAMKQQHNSRVVNVILVIFLETSEVIYLKFQSRDKTIEWQLAIRIKVPNETKFLGKIVVPSYLRGMIILFFFPIEQKEAP